MAEEKENQTAAPTESAKGGGSSKLVLLLIAGNMIATLAVAGVLVFSFMKEKKQASIADISTEEEAPAAEGEKPAGGHGGAEGEKKAEGGHGAPAAHGAAAEGGKKTASKDFGKMITLEQFTVNLASAGSVTPKFVRVNISVDVPNEEVESEFNQKMPQVRNTVIDLFNSKRPADLGTSENRNFLKEEIKNAFNSFMVTGKVNAVYFTNFALSQ